MKKAMPVIIQFFLWLSLLFLMAISALLTFSGCTTETEPPPAFVGHWAAKQDPITVTMAIEPAGTFSVSIFQDGETALRQDGRWKSAGNSIIMASHICQESGALVPCSAPDTLRVSISGDSWPVRWVQAGEIHSLEFRRVN